MVRYGQRRRSSFRRRRPIRGRRRYTSGVAPAKSYSQIGLDYLKKIGRAVAYGAAGAGTLGAVGAAYKYRNRFRPAAGGAGSAAMGLYDTAEGYAGGALESGRNAARRMYSAAQGRWNQYRLPNYRAQFSDVLNSLSDTQAFPAARGAGFDLAGYPEAAASFASVPSSRTRRGRGPRINYSV